MADAPSTGRPAKWLVAAVATVLQFALLPVITKARQAPRVVRTQPVA